MRRRLSLYISLMRLDKPVGIWLVLAPAMWGLWLASERFPPLHLIAIFFAGSVVMRTAGCIANDIADRHLDGKISRTKDRVLAHGLVKVKEAVALLIVFLALAVLLVLQLNDLTMKLSFVALGLALLYPFCKRITHIPQAVLGAAFAMAVPMAYAAVKGELDQPIWLVFTAVILWTMAYDTYYAMVDREDDLKAGIKSSAILFGEADRLVILTLQTMALTALWMAGLRFELAWPFYVSLIISAGAFIYHYKITEHYDTEQCFKAFKQNQWVGLVVWLGIVLSKLIV